MQLDVLSLASRPAGNLGQPGSGKGHAEADSQHPEAKHKKILHFFQDQIRSESA